MIEGGETLQTKLTAEILGHISQINSQRITIYKEILRLRTAADPKQPKR